MGIGECGDSIRRRTHAIPFRDEQTLENRPNIGIVIDDENGLLLIHSGDAYAVDILCDEPRFGNAASIHHVVVSRCCECRASMDSPGLMSVAHIALSRASTDSRTNSSAFVSGSLAH